MTSEPTHAPTHVVVGVDGSPPSIAALRWAAPIAVAMKADIDAVISWQFTPGWEVAVGHGDTDPEATAKRAVADAVTTAFGTTPPANLRTLAVRGNPEKVLLKASVDSDMLILGSRGHSGIAGLLLGSVSLHCAEHAAIPVVIVRGPTESMH
jgi:nucleotide-binding universal stress UspA family protein